jgi:DNA repair exonuclease SbcCD ATPase subunit
MTDWATEKAQEWLTSHYRSGCLSDYAEPLAALLREVALSEWGENAALRAEQTKVAEKLQNYIAMWKESQAEVERLTELWNSEEDKVEQLYRMVEEENFPAVAACPICKTKLGMDAKPIWRASILALCGGKP